MSAMTTTIGVTTATHAKLVQRGKKGQTFDDIIQELLKRTEGQA